MDPLFSLGELERRRRDTLRALERAGLLETNQQLELPELPLRIGLVTSKDSAAYHDFLTGIRNGPYAFEVVFAHAAMQGVQAEAQVASALGFLDASGTRASRSTPSSWCAAAARAATSRPSTADASPRRWPAARVPSSAVWATRSTAPSPTWSATPR